MRSRPPLAALAIALAAPFAAPSPVAARLGTDAVPRAESLELDLDAAAPEYTGTATIDLEVRREIPSFVLHAKEMTIESVRLDADGVDMPVRHAARGDEGELEVIGETPIPAGRYRLTIRFRNDLGTKAVAMYRVVKDGLAYSFTDLEPADAREAFPCFDEPSFKVRWQVTVRVPEGNEAVSNTPIELEAREGGKRTIRFARTPPLPSYLFALATGPFESRPIPGLERLEARVVTTRGQAALAGLATELTPPLLASLERWFGSPYPFAKLDFIAVPEFWPGAMENPGAITFAEGVLALPAQPTLAQRRRLAVVIAHELAHMWFGDLVTMAWWDDLWLNESFADYMAERTVSEVYPGFEFDLASRMRVQSTMSGDARSSAEPIRRPITRAAESLSGVGLAYSKGNAVLEMFQDWMGEEAFRAGLRDYLRTHAWGNAEAADLWRALGRSSGREVGSAMATFLDQPGLPLLELEIEEGRRLLLRQRRFAPAGVELEAQTWQIPLRLRFAASGKVHTRTFLLDAAERSVDLLGDGVRGPVEWVLPGAGGSGYFRWSVPGPMLEAIAAASGRLEPIERIAFIGNLSALLEGGQLSGDRYLRLLERFAADPKPQVVAAVVEALGRVRAPFVTADLEEAYAAYIRRVLEPALDRHGLEHRAGEPEAVALLRPALLGLLGDEGRDRRVLEHAARAVRRYLEDPDSVDPAVVGTLLNLAAFDGDRELFETYRKRFETAQVPAERSRFLDGLGHFRRPELLEEGLAYTLKGPLRPNETFTIPNGLPDDESGRARRWRWTMENFEGIAARLPRQSLSRLPLNASGCEPGRLEEARAFFADPARRADGTERTLKRLADSVNDCVRLRGREGEAVAAYLRAAAGNGGRTAAGSGER